MSVDRNCEHIHLEHDGKLLLVDIEGNGPAIPKKGRTDWEDQGFMIRLPTPSEATAMGLTWKEMRINRFRLGLDDHVVTVATPDIPWPNTGPGRMLSSQIAPSILWPGNLYIAPFTES